MPSLLNFDLKAHSISKHRFIFFCSQLANWIIWGFLILLLLGGLIIPLANIWISSIHTSDGWSLSYFKLLFSNKLLMTSIQNSFVIAFTTTLACFICSLPLAILFSRFDFPAKKYFSGLILTPLILPPFVASIGISKFFAQYGSINTILIDYGIINAPIDWLGETHKIWLVVALSTLHLYPIMLLNLQSSMNNIDSSLEEAALMVGAKKWRAMKDVLVPLIRPGVFAGATIIFIFAFTDLGAPLLVGYRNAVSIHIFNLVTDLHENPLGYALVCLVITMTSGLFIISKWFAKASSSRFQMLGRGHHSAPVRPLSKKFYLPIYTGLCGFIFIALIPHFGVILTSFSKVWFMSYIPTEYTFNAYRQVIADPISNIGIKNSLWLSITATAVNIVLGIWIGLSLNKNMNPTFQKILDMTTMMPLAIPGVVLAYAYIATYSGSILDPMESAFTLLIIAYSVRRIPYMVRSISSGLSQLNPSLEEASQIAGADHLTTLRKITLPLISANVAAGGVLCFTYSMLDVSDSLILAIKDENYPLTKSIYALFLEHDGGEYLASALGAGAMGILMLLIFATSSLLGKSMGELFRT